MTRAIAALFALLLATPALALECTGTNVLTQLQRDRPEVAARIAGEAAEVPNGEGLVWRVTDPKRAGAPALTLFGTMHLSDPRLIDLPPAARGAFEGADRLVLEVTELLDPAAMAGKAFQLTMLTTLTDGTTLDDLVPADALEVVKTAARDEAGLPWSVARRMQPFALLGQIALPACERARKAAGQPFLDIKLGEDAKARGLDIVGLETVEGQLGVIGRVPRAMMVAGLVDTVRMGRRIDDVFETMVQLYEEERIGLIWSLLKRMGPGGVRDPAAGVASEAEAAAYAEFQRLIVDERNGTMAEGIAPLVGKRPTFVAVGALHLPGETGLVRLLRQRGFTVERLTD